MTLDFNPNGGMMYPFQDGKAPPILQQRKRRNRRISSIVGVPSQSWMGNSEVEEIIDPRYNDYRLPDSRKASMEFNMANEQIGSPSYLFNQRRTGTYNFAGKSVC